ncbi:MAG: branched-chain amino acid ABC transporter permease [Oceanospirillales bacterium]|nr:branched-chain amino acid ABC transporter permease [Oceanospirillales bacterium]
MQKVLPKRKLVNSPKPTVVVAIVLALIALALPALLNAYWLKVSTSVVVYALAAAGASVLYARLGLVSLAQVALVGFGGWVALRIGHGTQLSFEFVLLLAGGCTALAGVIIGLPALKMRGLYFALMTLMAAGAFQIFVSASQFPNGGGGILGRAEASYSYMPRPSLGQSDAEYFTYALVVLTAGFLLVALHRRTRPGRAWALIRKSEACAIAAGVNVILYKMWAFALGGFLSGLAGALLAGSIGLLDARSFPASDSILLFALTVVGGAYSWIGQIITGILFRAVPALLNDLGFNASLSLVIFGSALIHALITAPQGLAGQLINTFNKLFKSRS